MTEDQKGRADLSRRSFIGTSAATGIGLAAAAAASTAGAQSSSSTPGLNRVEQWLEDLGEPALPVTGFDIEPGRTAILFTDPQNDFLHPDGVAYGAVGESARENNTIANMLALMEVAIATGMQIFISPHYYFPTDHGWKFEGTLEKLMHDIHMYDRPGYLNLEGFEGSGADWLEEFKPYINHESTIVCGGHKVFGPENNDLILQLQKQRVEKVLIAGMAANLCVESHLRELVERGFECAVVADATAGVKVPGLDGMLAALTNFTMVSSEVLTTKDAVKRIKDAYA